MNRKVLREFAVKLFYEMEIHKVYDRDMADHFFEYNELDIKDDYLDRITQFFIDHRVEIDQYIQNNCVSWSLSRMAKMDLSILRMSATEILYMDDIPEKVTANEAIELGKLYGDEKSHRFINGVLGNLLGRSFEQTDDRE